MPIYEYKCSQCGFEEDVLQKISDALLTNCPECKKETFSKQVSAAGFKLTGSGWYETDFKKSKKPSGSEKPSKDEPSKSTADSKSADSKSTSDKST